MTIARLMIVTAWIAVGCYLLGVDDLYRGFFSFWRESYEQWSGLELSLVERLERKSFDIEAHDGWEIPYRLETFGEIVGYGIGQLILVTFWASVIWVSGLLWIKSGPKRKPSQS